MDNNEIQKLAEEGKWDEIEKLLTDELTHELTPEERGAVYVNMMSLYMDVATKLNKEHADILKGILESLQVLKKTEHQVGDKMDLDLLRKKLQ